MKFHFGGLRDGGIFMGFIRVSVWSNGACISFRFPYVGEIIMHFPQLGDGIRILIYLDGESCAI